MRNSVLAVLGLIVITALVLFFRGGGDDPAPGPDQPPPPATRPAPTAATPEPAPAPRVAPKFYDFPQRENPPSYPVPPDDTRFTRTDDGKIHLNPAIELAHALNDPAEDPSEDLQHVAGILMLYRWIYQQNPVGDNQDIVRQLTGSNPRNLVVLPPDHPSISPAGELLDRFGHPYLFHAISETDMGIWSFGKDGVIGTDDDLRLEESAYFETEAQATE